MEIDAHTTALIAALDTTDKVALRGAVDALIVRGKDAELRAMLQDRLAARGHQNYWPVAYVLGNLPAPEERALSVLIDTLDHPDAEIRWAVALLLVRLARDNTALRQQVISLCGSGNENQRRMALYCVRDLALDDRASLAALLTAMRDPAPSVRVAAAISLKLRHDIDNIGKGILLDVYLNDPESKVRHVAAVVLAGLGAPDPRFVATLATNSESTDEPTKKAARAALDLLEKRRSAPTGSASGR